MAARLSFLGMGQMGRGMSKRVAEMSCCQKPVLLYNRTFDVALEQAHETNGTVAVKSLHAAIDGADIIWCCLSDERAVRTIYDRIYQFNLDGKLFVECSTVSPTAVDEIQEQLSLRGANLVAMPVFGEPSMASAGKLIAIPAGSAACVKRIRPCLINVIASSVVDFSDQDPKKAMILKIIGNALILTTAELVAELLVFADKSGLGVDNMSKLFEAMYPGGVQQHLLYSNKMSRGEYFKTPNVRVGTALNLSDKVLDFAHSHGVKLRAYEVAIRHLEDARDINGDDTDILGIYGAVRQEAGLKFKSD